MNLPARVLLAIACCGVAPSLYADDAGLLRCRAVVDTGARLACSDALAVDAAQRPRMPSSGSPPATATATATAAAAAAAAASPHTDFGLQSTPGAELKFVDSHINGRFEGWIPDQQITLANGQVWRIADGSRAFFEGNSPKVRIERGALGSFYMVIAGLNQAPRVRRVK